ncbi:NUDIX domain-containing protein [Streptomyces sp. GS7]|nr:NUDIX domain-containing protein [Streptomyces sp. GS7]
MRRVRPPLTGPATPRGRVLAVRRRIGEGKLSWQFPAGEVEPGESRENVAVRETKEETGQGRSAAPPAQGPVRCPDYADRRAVCARRLRHSGCSWER